MLTAGRRPSSRRCREAAHRVSKATHSRVGATATAWLPHTHHDRALLRHACARPGGRDTTAPCLILSRVLPTVPSGGRGGPRGAGLRSLMMVRELAIVPHSHVAARHSCALLTLQHSDSLAHPHSDACHAASTRRLTTLARAVSQTARSICFSRRWRTSARSERGKTTARWSGLRRPTSWGHTHWPTPKMGSLYSRRSTTTRLFTALRTARSCST